MNVRATLAGLALCAALGARDATACSCEMPAPPAEAFAAADVVFRGKVIEFQGTDAMPVWELRPFYFVVRFKVGTAWKGVSSPEFALGTGQGGGDCGKSFEQDVEYVVYAYRNDRDAALVAYSKEGAPSWPGYTTHICTRTARVKDAGEDLRFLKYQKPIPLRAPPKSTPAPSPTK